MRSVTAAFLIFISSLISAQDFKRELPDEKLNSALNTTNFPHSDAIIISKDQTLEIAPDFSRYQTFGKLVKILTQAGVNKYASYEYSYRERFRNALPAAFEIQARIQKSSGDIVDISDDNITKIVSLKDKYGNPVERKVIVKFPDLQVNDVVQIEQKLSENYALNTSGMFYYNDEDIVLSSTVYLTLPKAYTLDYYSFPESQIGAPRMQSMSKAFGAGDTYIWNVKNLYSVPKENYSFPFEDVSMFTGFLIKEIDQKRYDNWRDLGQNFYESAVDQDRIWPRILEELKFPENNINVTFGTVDSLYTKIKSSFKMLKRNSIYPNDKIMNVFDDKQGDATDLSFLMFKILEKWQQDIEVVLIRDRRDGVLEKQFPSLKWFDRLGLLVKIGNKEKMYDFDESIPNNFEVPWYFEGADLFVVNKNLSYFKTMDYISSIKDNSLTEKHELTFNGTEELKDNINLSYKGSFAQRMRSKNYSTESSDVIKYYESTFKPALLSTVDTVYYNNIYDNSIIDVFVKGISSSKPEAADSFLVVKLQDNCLAELRKKLFSTNRINHIKFDTPFSYNIEFKIHIPEGYTLKTLPSPNDESTPFNGAFQFYSELKGQDVILSGTFKMPQNVVDANNFNQLIELLDKSEADINKEIVFQKGKSGSI